MPALNFQKQFVADIAAGHKTTTIRTERKNPIKVGDVLFLYYGMRTKQCVKLCTAYCIFTAEITITENENDFRITCADHLRQFVFEGKKKKERTTDFIARRDGFDDYQHMVEWFKNQYSLPFTGVLIGWGFDTSPVEQIRLKLSVYANLETLMG
jgi:hypothetical protein